MKRWQKRLRLIALVLSLLLLLIPIGYGISNLWLVSPKGRAYICAKITDRTGLKSQLRSASWSPWNGISLNGLQLEQIDSLRHAFPEPFLTVEKIRIKPVWRQLLRKQIHIRGLKIHQPHITLPIDLLAELATSPPETTITAAHPPIAAAHPPFAAAHPPIATVIPSQPSTSPPITDSTASAEPPTPPAPPVRIAPIIQTTSPTLWINITDGSLKILRRTNQPPAFEIDNLSAKLPFSGRAAKSVINIENIRCSQLQIAAQMHIPIDWNPPMLDFNETAVYTAGIETRFAARLGFLAGLPFQLDLAVPEQHNYHLGNPDGSHVKISSFDAQGRLQAYLSLPATWQGQLLTKATGIDGSFAQQNAKFHTAQALFQYSNGLLRCADARAIGEEASVLGNAAILTDGRVAAIARIVAPPETLINISRQIHSEDTQPQLTPLRTPQRAALDIQLLGHLDQLFLVPFPGAQGIPINQGQSPVAADAASE